MAASAAYAGWLHLSTMAFLRQQGEAIELASYDNRLIAAAQALGFTLAPL